MTTGSRARGQQTKRLYIHMMSAPKTRLRQHQNDGPTKFVQHKVTSAILTITGKPDRSTAISGTQGQMQASLQQRLPGLTGNSRSLLTCALQVTAVQWHRNCSRPTDGGGTDASSKDSRPACQPSSCGQGCTEDAVELWR